MTVTQYVGARYVPDFAQPIEWNNTRTYEPLTIVTHQGNSYTSRQFVPLGIDIENETFWALTGNYNAQVEQYRHEVDIYKADVDSKLPQITEATEKGVEAVEQAAGEYVDIPNEINEINKRIDYLTSAKKLIVIGDSFSDHATSPGKMWCERLSNVRNVVLDNYAKGGAGFVCKGSSGKSPTFEEQLDQVIANQYKIDDIEAIIVYGGVNDYLTNVDENAERDAIYSFINKLVSTYSNHILEKTYIAFGNIGWGNQDRYNNYLKWYGMTYNRLMIYAPTPIVVPSIPYWLQAYTNTSVFKDDNLHPNETGNNIIASYFNQILSGCYSGEIRQIYKTSSVSEYFKGSSINIVCINGSVSITGVITTDGTTIAQGTYDLITDIDSIPFIGTRLKGYAYAISAPTPIGNIYIIDNHTIKITTFKEINTATTFYLSITC